MFSRARFLDGDKVRHRDGGPAMVVDSAAAGLVTCLIVGDDGLAKRILPASALVPVDEHEAVEGGDSRCGPDPHGVEGAQGGAG